jgi:hypothetical protein
VAAGAAVVLAVVFAVGGLAIVGYFVLLFVGMANFGSNK